MTILEIRKNSINNRKENIEDIFLKYNRPNFFIHYSSIPKLGINPQFSAGGTPVGVYGWPIQWVIEQLNLVGFNFSFLDLPFSNRKYIIIFEYIGTNPLKLTNVKKDFDFSKIEEYLSLKNYKNPDGSSITFPSAQKISNILFYKSVNLIASSLKESSFNNQRQIEVLWNKLLRISGYDAINDTKGDIMFVGEGPQICCLIPSVIKIRKILENPSPNII